MPPSKSNGSSRSLKEGKKQLKKSDSTDSSSASALKNQKVDRFGFIVNIDNQGKLQAVDDAGTMEAPPVVPNERQEKKLRSMARSWNPTANKRRQKQVLKKLRAGLPDTMRGSVWNLLGGVKNKMREKNGLYTKLLRQCEKDNKHMDNPLGSLPEEGPNKMSRSSSFQNIQETIERDIPRTYPRHTMFYDEENHRDDIPQTSSGVSEDHSDGDDSQEALGKSLAALCTEDLTTLMSELEVDDADDKKSSKSFASKGKRNGKKNKDKHEKCETIVEAKGGQAALRRVLCAYSYYDREVGYCQGMNFIAGMFITIMSEEEAFWLLVSKCGSMYQELWSFVSCCQVLTTLHLPIVATFFFYPAVMNDPPCRMRGLFGENMSETHKVLYVAEKLVHHFVPKLAKHLDKENVHVTMYATQWLMTQYTSSFDFDLVTRVWDCFLVEGFKVIYRVMLALLQHVQPQLLKMSFEEILGFFRGLPDQVDGDTIMEVAMKIPLKRKHIAKYEKEWEQTQKNN